ncbi:Blue copper protein 1b [Linum perenne]
MAALFTSNKRMVVLMVAVVVAVAGLVPTTLAVKYVVGDDAGWTNSGVVDYKVWAEGKKFFVGDSLVFNYVVDKHNVMKVNATDFQACTKPLAGPPPLTSGKDEVPLLTSGKKWYICGAPNHCASGQKLVITVSDGAASPAPTPNSPPNASARDIVSIGFVGAMVVGIMGMLLF